MGILRFHALKCPFFLLFRGDCGLRLYKIIACELAKYLACSDDNLRVQMVMQALDKVKRLCCNTYT